MADLITVAEAKTHLNLTGTTEHDANLTLKVSEASEMVISYLKNHLGTESEREDRYAEIDDWTTTTAPKEARSAVFRLVGHLFRFTGDDDQTQVPKLVNGDLPQDVTMFLKRLRYPTLA